MARFYGVCPPRLSSLLIWILCRFSPIITSVALSFTVLEVEKWCRKILTTQGVFQLSPASIESLLSALDRMDYGVFVFAPDDKVMMRGKQKMAARDNVVFGLGLFMGRLGRGRGFLVTPEGHNLHLPSDLLGVTPATYDPVRAKTECIPALGVACNAIREIIGRPVAGPVSRIDGGYHLQLSPGHSIELMTRPIQDASPDPKCGAVVLPANTSFDAACIHDMNSALGAYFQTHFASRIDEVLPLIREQLRVDYAGVDPLPDRLPPGTTVFMDRPLKTKHRIIVVGQGILAVCADVRNDNRMVGVSHRGFPMASRSSSFWIGEPRKRSSGNLR